MDIFKPLISRISQPIIFSFCIAWIFWNWEIVVGLLWYNSGNIHLYGYKNYKLLVNANANVSKNYIFPLLIAFAFPFIRFGLNWFNAFMRTKERSQILQTSGTGKMSTLRFLELKKSYDDRFNQISEYIDEEAKLATKLNNSETDKSKLEEDVKDLGDRISALQGELSSETKRSKGLLSDYEGVNILKKKYEKLSDIGSLVGKYIFFLWTNDHLDPSRLKTGSMICNGILFIEFDNKEIIKFRFVTDDNQVVEYDFEVFAYNILKDTAFLGLPVSGSYNVKVPTDYQTKDLDKESFFRIMALLEVEKLVINEYSRVEKNFEISKKYSVGITLTF